MNKKYLIIISCIFMFTCCFGCASQNNKQEVIEETIEEPEVEEVVEEETNNFIWEYSEPETEGVPSSTIDNMFNQLNEDVLSSIVVRNGKIIGEYFADGYDEESVFSLQSVSKSITGTLVGIAIDEGYIDSVNDYASKYLTILQQDKYQDKQTITIKELLDHTSGLVCTDSSLWVEWRQSDNWLTYLLDKPLTHEPGEFFEYSTGNTHILAAILEEVTGMSLIEYADSVLFKPLGITSAKMSDVDEDIYVKDKDSLIDTTSFDVDPSGVSDGGNGFSMSALDMARIGLLYARSGNWQGKQIVSSEYIDEATSIQARRQSNGSCYGYCWWTNRKIGNYIGYFGQGYYGQFIFVVPDIDLVVVFTSNNQHVSAMDYQNYVSIIAKECE